ncbi:MAG TPA: sugar phosphate isomerase/epimerase [Chloroflexota bacterium]|jgi:sugar phosphate isomerase/epimerase|nr:sugar phosphate isomerase/epimerase [Chloroflexota bacterium]
MKIGVFTVLLQHLPLEAALDYVTSVGLDTVELGAGNFAGIVHCNPAALLADEDSLRTFRHAFERRGLTISALNCAGNPLHPDAAYAAGCREMQRHTVLLAARLGIPCVIVFSGCPGASDADTHANWVTCPWPPEYSEILAWQWREKIIPHWRQEAAFAREHGNIKLCFEMHPGMAVYNPETLLKLRDAVDETVGCNFDPSHLFWQGIDPIKAIRALAGSIYHVHAKDCRIDPVNTPVNGVLDTKPYSDEIHRSWLFRTVGYGHGPEVWKDLVSTLRLVGYNGVLSIEHEDSLMSVDEGLAKAISFLKEVLIREQPARMWWA